MTVSDEVWKTVPGASMVAVSDAGRIWSHRTHRLLSVFPNNKGYLRVKFTDDAGRRVTCSLHVLVLEAHVGPRPPGHQACHGDGNKKDNRLANLRWDSPEANLRDRHGEQWPCPRCRGTGYVRGYDA